MTDTADYPSCVHRRKIFERCEACELDAKLGKHGGFERAEPTTEQASYRHTHLCINVRGALLHFRPSEWQGVVTRDDGTKLTITEIKEWLMDELAKGHRVIPLGKPCEGFSYETGCPGHEQTVCAFCRPGPCNCAHGPHA
jgi:hypothetical protein